jgi:quercetin dioxygenase-like cupin family protein
MASKPIVVSDMRQASDGWNEPEGRGIISWQTLISGDVTPTEKLTAGVAVVEPGGFLALHRHAPAEIYFILEGEGMVALDGTEQAVRQGDCIFIPPMAEHGCRNEGNAALRFLYVLPSDSFSEIDYLFRAKLAI